MQRGSVPVRKTPFPPDVLSGGFLLFPLAQRRYASPERGGACEAGGGVRKRRIRWGAFFSLPKSAVPTVNPQGILRIRRNQPLQSMAAGFVFCPAAASACRLSLPKSAVPTVNPQGIL
ncbi:MAG: hypothetical protein SOT76_10860, partial [Eubacteriales bacterium]|nr:hypothetical protein [Eubacteriales bacterium]